MSDRLKQVAQHFPQKYIRERNSAVVEEWLLSNPKSMNALSSDLVDQLIKNLQLFKTEGEPRVLLILGKPPAFCAGGDIVSMFKAHKAGASPDQLRRFLHNQFRLIFALSQSNFQRVALLDGPVMGAGVGLMWHAQFRVATERTLYAMPETQIGFFTDNGASYFFPRIKGGIELGLYLALTGKRVKGKEMIAYGLATHFVPSNKIGQLSNALKSDKIGSNESINEIISRFSTQVDEAQIPNLDSIRKIFRPDALSAIFSRLRSDKSDFSQQTLKTLSKMSPLALHITFELLQRGSTLTKMADCFEMESQLAHSMFEAGEIFEGVRALLVEKDFNPRWRYPTLESVTKHQISEMFEQSKEKLSFQI